MGAIAEIGSKVIGAIGGIGGQEAGSGSSPVDAVIHSLLGGGLKALEPQPSASNNSSS